MAHAFSPCEPKVRLNALVNNLRVYHPGVSHSLSSTWQRSVSAAHDDDDDHFDSVSRLDCYELLGPTHGAK